VAPGLVISFQERPGDVFDAVRNRIRTGAARIRSSGADYLAYALLDVTIDHYFITLEALGDEIEELEEEVLENPSMSTQRRVRNLRSNLAMIRRAVWPLREVLAFLSRDEDPVIAESTRLFLRDAYDHAIQTMDIVESLRDLVGGLQDLTLASISNRMNEVMKVLTIMGTIFIPLTFIAGIYGMNFDNMPELHLRYGYPIAMAVMLFLAVALLALFRRKEWL
jgi:magnesium transporter